MRQGRIVHRANSRISVLFVLELPLALVLPLDLNDCMPRLQAKALPFVTILRGTHTPITIAISELAVSAPLPPSLSRFRARVPLGEGHLPGNLREGEALRLSGFVVQGNASLHLRNEMPVVPAL